MSETYAFSPRRHKDAKTQREKNFVFLCLRDFVVEFSDTLLRIRVLGVHQRPAMRYVSEENQEFMAVNPTLATLEQQVPIWGGF